MEGTVLFSAHVRYETDPIQSAINFSVRDPAHFMVVN